MNKKPVRVRFAPSPTGLLNLGGARSALYNYLYAKKYDGSFVLRLEDTDRQRLVPEAVKQIQESLDWLGLKRTEGPNEGGGYGPYIQSERLSHYQNYAQKLLTAGHLYRCWCSSERLADLRQKAQAKHHPFKYDRHCLLHPENPDKPHVLRFRTPEEQTAVSWDDAVKGPLHVNMIELDDFVAVKSDGYPTYHLANVIDDHLMEISHVLRADEWLASTPKHLLLYQAFGWNPPVFAHLPAVLGKDKSKKLSKRDGAKSILDYRDEGYLPDAIINFLALLGWNEGEGSTKEIYSPQELTKAFSLERIQKSPAVFDEERLDWMNGLYIRQMSLDGLLAASEGHWRTSAGFDAAYRKSVLQLVQERLKKLSELDEQTSFFFSDPEITSDQFNFRHLAPGTAKTYLQTAIEALETAPEHFSDHSKLEAFMRSLAAEDKPVNFFMSLRIALTGQTATPPLFQTMVVLGPNTVVKRLKAALQALQI
jgi:glutamyl-tRNA synthetase